MHGRFAIHYKSGLNFSVHKLAKFSANPGKVHFDGLVHLLRYIGDNKTLVLKYYADLNDAPVTDLLRHEPTCACFQIGRASYHS